MNINDAAFILGYDLMRKKQEKHRRMNEGALINKENADKLHTHIHVCRNCNDEELCDINKCMKPVFKEYCDRCNLNLYTELH